MKWMTTAEVAETIRMSENYVSRMCDSGQLRAKKLGNQWRISDEALAEFMAGGKAAPARVREPLTKKQRIAVEQRRRSA